MVSIFYSYSHKDESLCESLQSHLALLRNQGLIDEWYDRDILAGDQWRVEIDEKLESADIILLLVSSDFLSSEYCYSIEMKRALERHKANMARVIPIILRPCDWKYAPFGELEALPKNGEAITSDKWKDQDAAFANIAKGIRKVVKELSISSPDELKTTYQSTEPNDVIKNTNQHSISKTKFFKKPIKWAIFVVFFAVSIVIAYLLFEYREIDNEIVKLQNLEREYRSKSIENDADKTAILKIVYDIKTSARQLRQKVQRFYLFVGHLKHYGLSNWMAEVQRIETEYSYARFYQKLGKADPICRNLTFQHKGPHVQLSDSLRKKCDTSILDQIVIGLSDINFFNFNTTLHFANDTNFIFCSDDKGPDCDITISDRDRFAGKSFEYVLVPEFVGYEIKQESDKAILVLSILHRKEIDKQDSEGQFDDKSYWNYRLVLDKRATSKKSYIEPCLPFFDNDDDTKLQPSIKGKVLKFGKGVLRACGRFRGRVTKGEFRALVDDHEEILRAKVDYNQVLGSSTEFLDKIEHIWMTHVGFDHVFCGEWQNGTINGFHYWGQYLHFQNEGVACFDFLSPENGTGDGGIYTVGVISHNGANRHSRKGYALSQSAEEIFRIGTLTFLKCCDQQDDWQYYEPLGTYDKKFIVKSTNNDVDISNVVICKATAPEDRSTYGVLTVYPVSKADNSVTGCNID